MFVDAQDLSGDLAVFGETAAPGVPVKSEVDLVLAAEEISAFACRAFSADICGIVRYDSLSHMPVFDKFSDLYDVACKFMAAD